jgi:hypothetical protein
MPPRKALAIYLQDHLAGATAGVNLARRCAARNTGSSAGGVLTEVASEIEADRATLRRLLSHLGVHPSRLKIAAAWLAERVARLKPNGRLGGEPLMQRLHELEVLSLGIAGKHALWQALRVVPAVAEQPDIDLDALAERALVQRERVEAERMAIARAALAPGGTAHRLRDERPA